MPALREPCIAHGTLQDSHLAWHALGGQRPYEIVLLSMISPRQRAAKFIEEMRGLLRYLDLLDTESAQDRAPFDLSTEPCLYDRSRLKGKNSKKN